MIQISTHYKLAFVLRKCSKTLLQQCRIQTIPPDLRFGGREGRRGVILSGYATLVGPPPIALPQGPHQPKSGPANLPTYLPASLFHPSIMLPLGSLSVLHRQLFASFSVNSKLVSAFRSLFGPFRCLYIPPIHHGWQ